MKNRVNLHLLLLVLVVAGAMVFLLVTTKPIQTTVVENPNIEDKFCGGIAGLTCPEGYECILDGNYPDAGGTCTSLHKQESKLQPHVSKDNDCQYQQYIPDTNNDGKQELIKICQDEIIASFSNKVGPIELV